MKKIKRFIQYCKQEIHYIFSKDDFYFEKDWGEFLLRDKNHFKNRFNVVYDLIRSKGEKLSVADIGAGGGELLQFLLSKGIIDSSSVGIDSYAESVSKIKKLGVRGILADASSKEFELADKYDFIIMAEFVEHIRDIEDVLIKLKLKYKYGIIITTPNLGYVFYRLRLLFGRFPYLPGLHPREHVRFWTILDFKIWAKQVGYKVKEIKGCAGFPILYRIWPSWFCYDVLYWIE